MCVFFCRITCGIMCGHYVRLSLRGYVRHYVRSPGGQPCPNTAVRPEASLDKGVAHGMPEIGIEQPPASAADP